LLLTTLSTSKSEKEDILLEDGGGVLWRAAVASNGSLVREAEGLGSFLLPNGRPGRCFTGTEEEETAMEAP
jgi:hypothetical protein